ncbi:WD40 repeat domain-containing protein [Herpetosiphon giganteus]|uniref:WD40 repeat domain-containing protein n=1 Tax=Herpetosiphon giganteus TaxID=2029754 RepID=UPI001958A007|nr:WD40 repeat domain-containing protein [Herpetosiphon giganteus]MBM7845143.1 hypothetical protein [Herpetosiphon giganteus]
MRRMFILGSIVLLLVACGQANIVPATSSPAVQSAQNPYPTPVLATAIPTVITATVTSVPTGIVPSPTLSHTQQIIPLELTLNPPSWGTWNLETITSITTSQPNLQLWGWSRDGTRLLYSQDQTLRIMTVASQDVAILAQNIQAAVWSPQDDQILAYVIHDTTRPQSAISTVWLYDSVAQSTTKIGELPLPPHSSLNIRWNLEQGLVLATDARIIVLPPHANGGIKTLFDDTHPSSRPSMQLSPNGHHAVLTKPTKQYPIRKHPIKLQWLTDGNVTAAISITEEYPRIIWSQDSRYVAFNDATDTIVIADANGFVRYKTNITRSNQAPLAWSPDNQYFVYQFNTSGQSPHNAYIAKLGEDGSIRLNEQSMERKGGAVLEVMWSPNNDYIAYTLLSHENPSNYGEFILTIRRIVR